MTYDDFKAALETLSIPSSYGEWLSPPAPPYITWQFAYSSDLKADNQNYIDIGNYQVELYTKKKDPATETLVQNKLKEFRLPYSKTETYLESEKMRQVVYEIKLIGG